MRFVQAFRNDDDLAASTWRTMSRVMTGVGPSVAVSKPVGLALSPDETRLYTTSIDDALVVEIDFALKRMRHVANVPGREAKRPLGVAVDGDGNIYVSDTIAHRVMVYGRDGGFRLAIGEARLERPKGLAIDRTRRRLYVVDGLDQKSDKHAVEVFDLEGKHIKTIGKKGRRPGELYFPTYVAVAPDGRIYVADTLNFRVQVFDPEGQPLLSFGQAGQGPGSFGKIKGIAVDAFGAVHVVDGEFGVVQVFNPKGQLLMYYGGRAEYLEYFDLPTAIVVSSKNQIYVGNYYVSRVNQYEIINTTQDEVGPPPPLPQPTGGDAAPAAVEARPAAVETTPPPAAPAPATPAPTAAPSPSEPPAPPPPNPAAGQPAPTPK
ncbi:MAG: SMP-30/gluconolactonase/LRE family protein [Deltaproteobacteria bacterium]|nr:SMP-30/gluconolactonase/LRE family protein [Deltaproteobacteria bacterium]